MKLLDNFPIFFRINVNNIELKSTRARASGDGNYQTIFGMGAEEILPGTNEMFFYCI